MYVCPACDNCADLAFPAIVENCNPVQNESEIGYWAVSVPDPTNINTPKIKSPDFSAPDVSELFIAPDGFWLSGIGDMPVPESGSRVGSLRRVLRDVKKFTVNFTVDDDSEDKYTLMRSLECLPNAFAWFITLGGKVYGDPANGIPITIQKADAPLDRGEGSYARMEYIFGWSASCHPERQDSWLSPTVPT